jgi:DNA-binding NtrC family response regulator
MARLERRMCKHVVNTRLLGLSSQLLDTARATATCYIQAIGGRRAAQAAPGTSLAARRPRVTTEDVLDRIAPSDLGVVLLGGDGPARRELAATIHGRSGRASAPFESLDCTARGRAIEVDLFGRAAPRSFTPGVLERARGGTVFLDALDHLDAVVQVKLLRALQERQVVAVGGRSQRPIDVRMIVGADRDLALDVARGRLRADLYYRLAGISIDLASRR